MRRRTFITALGGVALLPLAGRAQQPARMRRVGVLLTLSERALYSGNGDDHCAGAGTFRVGRGQEYPDGLSLLPRAIQLSLTPMPQRWSVSRQTRFLQALRQRSRRCSSIRPRYRSFSCSCRSRRAGLCSEPRATRRQHHGVHLLRRPHDGKMAATPESGCTSRHASRRHLQPRYQRLRTFVYSRDRSRRPDV